MMPGLLLDWSPHPGDAVALKHYPTTGDPIAVTHLKSYCNPDYIR